MTDPREPSAGVLDQIVALEPAAYEVFDLNRLTSFTVHWLQERQIPTTFENIVVAAFRMFPAKFGLEGYPGYPDAARINRALLQLGPKYRNWARGSVQKGFLLSESGLEQVQKVKDALAGVHPPEAVKARGGKRPRTMNLSEEVLGVEKSSLFAKWTAGRLADGTFMELLHMLNAYAYTPPRALRERLGFIENAVTQVGRDDLLRFLEAVRSQFAPKLKEE